jgi:hypothetical protein
LGGVFLGCFQSEQVSRAQAATPVPIETALAVKLPGNGYDFRNLEELLSAIKDGWAKFSPLKDEFKETYRNRLNELIKQNGQEAPSSVSSIKEVLVSIEQPDRYYYVITSVKSYEIELNGKRVLSTIVHSGAVVLRGDDLIRLTVQQSLTDPADVPKVQSGISDWARAVFQSVVKK